MKVEELTLLIDLLDKLGYNTETAGIETVFQRLAQIVDYVDTLETKVGTNADAGGTTTVFARLAQIAGYVDQVEGYTDTLETNLGSNADAASSTGSAHAKLKDIKNYLPSVKPVVTVQRGTTSVQQGAERTVTISSVTLTNSFVIATSKNTCKVRLIDSTTLGFESAVDTNVAWEIVTIS